MLMTAFQVAAGAVAESDDVPELSTESAVYNYDEGS